MPDRNEERYRKWIGICQMTQTTPLTLLHTWDDDNKRNCVKIKHREKVLLILTPDEFDKLTAIEIIEMMGVNNGNK